MPRIETVYATQAYRTPCEDCVAVFQADDRTVIAVADGAGGTGSGDVAAKAVVREIQAEYLNMHSASEWGALLQQVDKRISDGESTAVVVDIRDYGIAGASVGDNQAWIICDGEIADLTQHQVRKPLLGSGNAVPVPFTCRPLDGVLLVATDGFCNYVKREAIGPLVSQCDFYELPKACINLVQLPSGEFWDDVGIVAARVCPARPTRKRYTI